MIASEYQAMADEIDRIANATDFNGIKLLDGSLSGVHDGSGMAATGALKIHFGFGNDSAEDYYYIQIGNCTAAALGLGKNAAGENVSMVVKREIVTYEHMSITPRTSYIQYTDPVTGKKYYSDGDYYFSAIDKPVKSSLSWETDGKIIERLVTTPQIIYGGESYDVYSDPQTGREYYRTLIGGRMVSNPQDPANSKLDANNPADAAILARLRNENRKLSITIAWSVYENENGNKYYTCDNGKTFVPNYKDPASNSLRSDNPADRAIIDTLKESMVVQTQSLPSIEYWLYKDPLNNKNYYLSDNGQTIISNSCNPANSILDPDDYWDKIVLDRIEIVPDTSCSLVTAHGGSGEEYYTKDKGKTFFGK